MENYVDASFSKDFTQHYSLLMQIEEHQFAFVLYEKPSGKLVVLKKSPIGPAAGGADFLTRLKVAITREDLLHVPTYEQKIGFAFGGFTLVPTILFDEKSAAGYLQLNTRIAPESQVLINYVRKIFVKNVFSIAEPLYRYLYDTNTHPKLFHITTPLLEWALLNKSNFNRQQLILDVKQSVFQVLYFEGGEFKYINQFEYKDKEDFLYFLLLVCDQLQIDRNAADLKLGGEIVPDSQLFTGFWKFFANISFCAIPPHFKLPSELEETSMHFYNSLLSLHLCE